MTSKSLSLYSATYEAKKKRRNGKLLITGTARVLNPKNLKIKETPSKAGLIMIRISSMKVSNPNKIKLNKIYPIYPNLKAGICKLPASFAWTTLTILLPLGAGISSVLNAIPPSDL